MKAVIQRALPLNLKYFVTGKKYIPIEQSAGAYCCDNCGKLIANIASVRNEKGDAFNIGFDCLETILVNNNLLSAGDIADYERIKKMIPKILRAAKSIKETIARNPGLNITGLLFEIPKYTSDFFTFYWLHSGLTQSRDNDYLKLKEMDYSFLLETLRNIFPHLTIIEKS